MLNCRNMYFNKDSCVQTLQNKNHDKRYGESVNELVLNIKQMGENYQSA